MEILNEIKEAKYLTVEKSSQYRRIMRIFFNEYEKMNFQLYQQDIFNKVKEFVEFENYDINKVKTDLDILTEYGNLIAVQDTKRVNTIAEFKNREYRYSMSDKAIIIERMTINLEKIQFESKNLSTNYIVRIIEALEKMKFLFENEEEKEIFQLWNTLQNDFKHLNQSYQDYLKEFYTRKTEELMKTTEFLLYKEKFISILKSFIRELQRNSSKMERILKEIENLMINEILNSIIRMEIQNQELNFNNNFKITEDFKVKIKENILGKWYSLKNWFISAETRKSEYRQIMEITEDIIKKIVQEAYFITQKQNYGSSKKIAYKKFMNLFINCQDIEEAHKLSGYIFGIQRIRHFQLNPTTTISNESSVYSYEEGIKNYVEYTLESHNRVYKPKVEKTGFEDRSKLKEKLMLEYRQKLENDKKRISKYLKVGILDISKIEDVISSEFRIFILNMISMASLSKEKIGITEYGQKYKLKRTEGTFTLKCEDGDLEMPKYIFEFLED